MKKLLLSMVIILILGNVTDDPLVYAQKKFVFSTYPDSGLTLLQEPIVRELYKRMGIEIEIKKYPAQRALTLSNEGMVDGELSRLSIIRETYKNLIMIPVPLHYPKSVAFVKNINFSIEGYQSLKPYKVVTLRGFKFSEKKLKEHQVEHILVTTSKQAFKLLDSGRYDVALFTRIDGLKTLKDLKMKGITGLEPPFDITPSYHFVHKKHEALVPQLTATLKKMQEEKILEKIEKEVISDLIRAISK